MDTIVLGAQAFTHALECGEFKLNQIEILEQGENVKFRFLNSKEDKVEEKKEVEEVKTTEYPTTFKTKEEKIISIFRDDRKVKEIASFYALSEAFIRKIKKKQVYTKLLENE